MRGAHGENRHVGIARAFLWVDRPFFPPSQRAVLAAGSATGRYEAAPTRFFQLVQRASQPEQRIHRSTLGKLIGELSLPEWRLTTMMLVGDALSEEPGMVSRLYDAGYAHRFRKVSRK